MNRNIVSRYGRPAEYQTDDNPISRPDQLERQTALAPVAALIIVVLASLGLWWASVDHSPDSGNHGYVLMGQAVLPFLGVALIVQVIRARLRG